MDNIQDKTCLKFVERTAEKDFLEFNRGTECSSNVGREGNGKQRVVLGHDCFTPRTLIHEVWKNLKSFYKLFSLCMFLVFGTNKVGKTVMNT